MQHGARLIWGYGCPQTPMTRHIIEIDDKTGDGWCCQCAETFSRLEIYNEQLREALTWAVGFIACNSTDRSYQKYPDYQNAEALVSSGMGLMFGPFQLALSQIEVLQRDNERLSRWRRLLIETPKGEARQTGLERFAQVEALQPMLEPWRHQVAELKAETLLLRSKISHWIQGDPPSGTEVAWLLTGEPEEVKRVVLGVFVEDEGWCESGDWRGESYGNQVTDLIICWQPYHIPSKT